MDSESIFVPLSQTRETPCSLCEEVTQPLCQRGGRKSLLFQGISPTPEEGVSFVCGGESPLPTSPLAVTS